MGMVEITQVSGNKMYVNPIHIVHVVAGAAGDTEITLDQRATVGLIVLKTKEAIATVQHKITVGLT